MLDAGCWILDTLVPRLKWYLVISSSQLDGPDSGSYEQTSLNKS
jgi:hypothetical protein